MVSYCSDPVFFWVRANCEFFTFGILGQVWYLIVTIPDLCTLTYFKFVFFVCGFMSRSTRRLTGSLLPNPILVAHTRTDVASDVGVNFKNVGVLSFESSLFHSFHYTFLQTVINYILH